jgi:hypothetical protein
VRIYIACNPVDMSKPDDRLNACVFEVLLRDLAYTFTKLQFIEK